MCICQWVTPTVNEVEVLLLQHPMEMAQAKGSAQLLNLSLSRSYLLTGEVFGAELTAALQPPRHNILLYPETPGTQAFELPKPSLMDANLLQHKAGLRLVVLDGTWRKSRKMLHLNWQLQKMPRLSLADVPASRYLIRKAHGAHQLSTLEATCAALGQLEIGQRGQEGADKYEALLKAFDGFVAQHLAYRPIDVP